MEDRKRQLNQLAAMGVVVPDAVRGDMAIAGEWQVVSERVIGEDGKEVKKGLSTGVRKRKLDEEEQEQIAAQETITKKKGWGNRFKKFPGKMGDDDEDVEALFKKKKVGVKQEEIIKGEPDVKAEEGQSALRDIPTEAEAAELAKDADAKAQSEEDATPVVVFKKRKKKLAG